MRQDAATAAPGGRKTVLWWGRFDSGYSRNRILRAQFHRLGWTIADFRPRVSALGDLEARLRRLPVADLVWVPCFRQRDLAAAARWSAVHGVPLAFDPLISAYDKQVDERGKWSAGSHRARRLLAWERGLLQRPDLVVADTPAHADYFAEVLGVARCRLAVVYVGAEAGFFSPTPVSQPDPGSPLEALFYGSFLPLQGPGVVVEAARRYRGRPVQWTLLGQGALRSACEEQARGLANVRFEDWLPYAALPDRIRRAQILLGVFGTTPKAGRVIPNKVYQAMACGRVVVTRAAEAYPPELRAAEDSGLVWTAAGDAQGLADRVAALAEDHDRLRTLSDTAAMTSAQYFSEDAVRRQLDAALQGLPPARASVA
jgi:glycosyltransferase involved in cell wall biosynthesis